MEFSAKISKSDFKLFNEHATEKVYSIDGLKTKSFFLNTATWILLGIAGAAMLGFYESCIDCKLSELNISIIFFLLWLAASYILQRWFYSAYVNRAVDKKGTTLGEYQFIINDNEITQKDETSLTSYTWDAIQSVVYDDNVLLLFIDVAKAIIIPTKDIPKSNIDEIKEILLHKKGFVLNQ